MKRIFLPLLFAVSVSYGQNNAPGADTTDGSLAEAQLETAADSTATASLDTVRVKAATVVTKIDRKLVFPTGQQIAGAANGVELLRRLMLPRLNVDPVTNSIGILGGGEVQLRINGVKAEQQEIAALQPQDVIRVEYHDNPGIRYGNAAAVVDFIVRRHETGGSAGADINNTFKLKTNGYRNLRAKLNHRKSEFSIYYSGSHSGLEQMWRDNEETFRFADGTTLRRIEEGTPNRHQTASNYFGANYNYQTDKRMLNVGLKNTARNQPHHDFAGKLYNADNTSDYVDMFDRSTKFSNSPSLDIYYQEYMKNNQTLALNVVGTYGDTESSRAYGESRAGTLLTDVRNRALGSRYSVIGEGIYEKRRGDNRLTFGARHTYASTDNRYDDGQNNSSNTLMRQNDTYAYGEWASKVKKLSYMVGAGVTHSHVAQQGAGEYDRVTFNPRLSLLYPLSGSSSLRLRSGIYNNNPSPANMSAVDQMIDSLRMQRGNPNLLSFITGSSTLSYEYQKDIYWVSLSGSYEVRPRAVMEEQREENGRFVTTWANQRSWQKANALLGLRVGPIKKILVIQANAGVNHFISDGNSYRHVYTSPFLSTSLFGMYKNFTLFVDWQVEGDGFDGETMDGGQKNMHSAGLAYKWKNLNAMIVMTMPFVNNLYVESENRSALASYKRRLHTNDVTRMLMFQLGYNLSWGRQYQAGQKRLNNKYEEEGVMETKK